MRFPSCLLLIALGFGTARADDTARSDYTETGYFGAGITNETVNQVEADIRGATTWKVLAGLRTSKWLALEADYFGTATHSQLQTFCASVPAICSTERSSASALAGYLVGLLPARHDLDLYLKVGVDLYKVTNSTFGGTCGTAPCPTQSATDTGIRPCAGAGVQGHFGRVGVRFEYERLPAAHTNSMELFSLAVILSTG